MPMLNDYPQKIIQVLKDAKEPLNIGKIMRLVDIRNWQTAKALCLDLAFDGKIQAEKTRNGFVFWVEKNNGAKDDYEKTIKS